MRFHRAFILPILLSLSLAVTAQSQSETVALQTADGVSLAGDFYPPSEESAPLIIALHMLNSNRSAYAPIIPDLQTAGYALLNVDLRGHGDSGGARDWDLAIDDVAAWIDWLTANGHIGERGLVIMGASIGANVSLMGCAASDVCRGAIALSPGLDYRGLQPETALTVGLAERSALLVAAHDDSYSAATVRQLFANAQGDVTARLFRGHAHGTRLFDSDYNNVSRLILSWLDESFPLQSDFDDPVCDLSRYKRGQRGYILCSSVKDYGLKNITEDHCLWDHLVDQDDDGLKCEG